VLSGKDKIGVFDETVHQTDHFAHDGDETDFSGFTVGEQALIKRREDRIGTSSRDG
jgi:hypothetical protein